MNALEGWVAAGFPPSEFWQQTPRTIKSIMRGAAERQRLGYRQAAWLAQWTGALAQSDPRKQPGIDKMIGHKPKPMTGKQIANAMLAWSSAVNAKFAASPPAS